MRVGFTGAQGTGKTTLLRAVEKSDLGFTVVPSTARQAVAAGYEVNESATPLSQMVTTVSRCGTEDRLYRETGRTISDRTPLDSLAYTLHQTLYKWDANERNDFYWQVSQDLVSEHMRKYDAVFYFPVYWAPKADGIRSDSVQYQKSADSLIRLLLEKLEVPHIVMPMGTTDKRLLRLTRTLNL